MAAASEATSLPGLWDVTPYGAIVGMVIFLFLGLARGWVIPRNSHEREMAASNKRGDEWKETAEMRGELITELTRQNGILVDSTKTSAEFFGTVTRDGGGKHVGQEKASSG